ncbi:MAG: c-type cytochrome, partial [Acidimicrobiia bacterium]|nr:c-type cytochrome [Acidimicrobiia bacterium]
PVDDIDARARQILETLGEGVDTAGDGVSDAAEDEINSIQLEFIDALLLPNVGSIAFDPTDPATTGRPDLEVAEEVVATYRELADSDVAPALGPIADQIEGIIENDGELSEEAEEPVAAVEEPPAEDEGAAGEDTDQAAVAESPEPTDTDGDGLTDQAEQQISGQISQAVATLLPDGFATVELDPANPESTGSPDLTAADTALNAIGAAATGIRLNADNGPDQLIPAAERSLGYLEEAQRDAHWEFDFQTIADESFGGDVETAQRTVGIYQGYCARCHTSGYSAGLPLVQEPGSGGFGPALWDGRPAVQFLDDESLVEFLKVGAVANQPYGVNGFGNGQMPGFGTILSEDDLSNLATWLRDGNLDGQEGD